MKIDELLVQIRCSAAAIRFEVGRFDHGVYIPVDERIYQICNEGVEDELHILLNAYSIMRCRCVCLAMQMS